MKTVGRSKKVVPVAFALVAGLALSFSLAAAPASPGRAVGDAEAAGLVGGVCGNVSQKNCTGTGCNVSVYMNDPMGTCVTPQNNKDCGACGSYWLQAGACACSS